MEAEHDYLFCRSLLKLISFIRPDYILILQGLTAGQAGLTLKAIEKNNPAMKDNRTHIAKELGYLF